MTPLTARDESPFGRCGPSGPISSLRRSRNGADLVSARKHLRRERLGTPSRLTSWIAGIAAALFLVGCSKPTDPGRGKTGLKVVVVGLDGTHLALLSPLLEEGRLPHLRRYLGRATVGVMSSPIHEGFTSPALWTSMVTGVEPYRHGVTHFVLPEPRTCVDVAAASGHRTAPALWNLLTDAGLRSGIVGLWATWPAEAINGAIVTDHVTYSRMRLSSEFSNGADTIPFDYATEERNVSPASLGPEVTALVQEPNGIDPALLGRFADFSTEELRAIVEGTYTGGFNRDADRMQELKVTLQSDRSYADIGQLVAKEVDPALLWVYLEGIDVIEHRFWPYHDAKFPRPVDGDRERFHEVLNRYVEYTDTLIRPYLEMASDDTVVLVVSDHGYTTVADDRHPSGHWHDHNAIFFAAGGPIKQGHILEPGLTSIYDITPTILTLLGLPVAADLAGEVITDAIDPTFLKDHPSTSIATFGRRESRPEDISASADDPLFIQRMTELGYIGKSRNTPGGPIDLEHWQLTPHVFARLANQCDLDWGRAAFISDARSNAIPGPGPMPRCAIYTDEKNVEHPVIVIQVESTPTRTKMAFRHLDGSLGHADGSRVKILDGPNDRFHR